MSLEHFAFDQVHIDIARNSTDDFNPFHDPLRWDNIAGNPFAAPIALGFQLEFLASDRILRHRESEGVVTPDTLPFRNFEFNFAGALRPGEQFGVDVRRTVARSNRDDGLSNRVVLRKADGTPVLIGTQSDTPMARFLVPHSVDVAPSLSALPDRSVPPGSGLFLKRKYLTTSNAKNFALGALCRQHDYIDELDERICFAPLFTASLISCALLERGLSQGHDFEAQPMVYTSHQISVDMRLQTRLRSNDRLHFLVAPPQQIAPGKGLGKAGVARQLFYCVGLVGDHGPLFQARVQLAPLQALSELRDRRA